MTTQFRNLQDRLLAGGGPSGGGGEGGGSRNALRERGLAAADAGIDAIDRSLSTDSEEFLLLHRQQGAQ